MLLDNKGMEQAVKELLNIIIAVANGTLRPLHDSEVFVQPIVVSQFFDVFAHLRWHFTRISRFSLKNDAVIPERAVKTARV